jgi:hypothetical protein
MDAQRQTIHSCQQELDSHQETVDAQQKQMNRLKEQVAWLMSGRVRQFVHVQSAPLDGIIAHLTKECGGHVHDHGVVEVTSSPSADPSRRLYDAKNVADLKDSVNLFHSSGVSGDVPHTRNNWICYDFKNRKVMPTHYSIRSHDWGKNNAHLKSWVVEVSLDGEEWTEIDRKENTTELQVELAIGTFAVSRSEVGRLFRIVQIGKSHRGCSCLTLCALELFGGLVE